ncbi:MAG: ATP synthase F0 subunit C [Pyrinomonadaceae bacterium]
MMSKFRLMFFTVIGLLFTAVSTFAQTDVASSAADNLFSVNKYKAIAVGIGFAIAVAGGAIGQGRIGGSAVEAVARNPSASGRIQFVMVLALALIESLVLFALLVVFTKI